MSRALAWKLAAILAIMAGLALPLELAQDLVAERRALRDRVMLDMAQSGTAAQRLEGLVLLVPCTDRFDEGETLENGRTAVRQRTRSCDVRVLPRKLRIQADLGTEFRHRGIYRALVYRSAWQIDAAFELPAHPTPPGVNRTWGQPRPTYATPSGAAARRSATTTPRAPSA